MEFSPGQLLKNRFLALGLIAMAVFVILFFLSIGRIYDAKDIDYGVTFSPKQASDLGLDWKETYLSMLNDLSVKNLRLSAYWNVIEKNEGEMDWTELDWLIERAVEKDAKIILAVGGRLPRWPECHYPDWTADIPVERRQDKQLDYIRAVISRYKDNKQITAWQVENEPFLVKFGECPPLDISFLDQEIALVHELDMRPVVVTDSGELSIWVPAARRGDFFGTTMYRDTYSDHFKAYIHYPITPAFFRIKKKITSLFASPEKWMVIELQSEPWGPKPFQHLAKSERDKTMSEKKFTDILEFARKTGFREYYLWGAEWWYWEKTTQDNPFFWNEAKKLFIK